MKHFFLKWLLALSLLAFFAEGHLVTKRDTIHRIVLKSGKSKGGGKVKGGERHKVRGGKYHKDLSEEDDSRGRFEDAYRGYSDEDSFERSLEDFREEKRHQKRHRKPQRHADYDAAESRRPDDVPKKKKKHRKAAPLVEFTTGYPVKEPPHVNHYEQFPPLAHNFEFPPHRYEPLAQTQQFPVIAPGPLDYYGGYLPAHAQPPRFEAKPSNHYEVFEPALLRDAQPPLPRDQLLKANREVLVQKPPNFQVVAFNKAISKEADKKNKRNQLIKDGQKSGVKVARPLAGKLVAKPSG